MGLFARKSLGEIIGLCTHPLQGGPFITVRRDTGVTKSAVSLDAWPVLSRAWHRWSVIWTIAPGAERTMVIVPEMGEWGVVGARANGPSQQWLQLVGIQALPLCPMRSPAPPPKVMTTGLNPRHGPSWSASTVDQPMSTSYTRAIEDGPTLDRPRGTLSGWITRAVDTRKQGIGRNGTWDACLMKGTFFLDCLLTSQGRVYRGLHKVATGATSGGRIIMGWLPQGPPNTLPATYHWMERWIFHSNMQKIYHF